MSCYSRCASALPSCPHGPRFAAGGFVVCGDSHARPEHAGPVATDSLGIRAEVGAVITPCQPFAATKGTGRRGRALPLWVSGARLWRGDDLCGRIRLRGGYGRRIRALRRDLSGQIRPTGLTVDGRGLDDGKPVAAWREVVRTRIDARFETDDARVTQHAPFRADDLRLRRALCACRHRNTERPRRSGRLTRARCWGARNRGRDRLSPSPSAVRARRLRRGRCGSWLLDVAFEHPGVVGARPFRDPSAAERRKPASATPGSSRAITGSFPSAAT